jgi:hypothetical protein
MEHLLPANPHLSCAIGPILSARPLYPNAVSFTMGERICRRFNAPATQPSFLLFDAPPEFYDMCCDEAKRQKLLDAARFVMVRFYPPYLDAASPLLIAKSLYLMPRQSGEWRNGRYDRRKVRQYEDLNYILK